MFDPRFQALDASGKPYSGAKLAFYRAGTTSLVTVYQNATGSTPHTNPVTADTAGVFPAIYLDTIYPLKAILRSGSGVTLQTIERFDPAPVGVHGNSYTAEAAADLPTPSNEFAEGIVLNDPDPANNGLWYRDGAAWVKGRSLPDTLARMTVTGGTSDDIEASTLPGVDPASVSMLWVEALTTNTGPVTINGKPVLTIDGADLLAGQWLAGRTYWFTDEGDHYKLRTESDVSGLVAQAEAAATAALGAAGAAAGAAGAAATSANEAAGYAAGLNIAPILPGDAGKLLRVNAEGDGSEWGQISIVEGDGIAIDNTDPAAPEISVVAFTGDAGSGGALGGVPAPAAGDSAARKFLMADGTWTAVQSVAPPSLDPHYIETFLTVFHGRGMLAAETPNIVSEQSITATAAAGAFSVVGTDGAKFKVGGNVTIKHDNGRYWTYFVSAISTHTVSIRPALRWSVSAGGGAKMERTWYNQAHPGKFAMRQMVQMATREKGFKSSMPRQRRAFFTQFLDHVGTPADALTAISGAVINYYDESSTNVASANDPVRFAIGKAAYIEVGSSGQGAKTLAFSAGVMTRGVVRIVAHRTSPDGVYVARLMNNLGDVAGQVSLAASEARTPTVYHIPFQVRGQIPNLHVEFVATSVGTPGVIIVDEVSIFDADIPTAPPLTNYGQIVVYGDSWAGGDLVNTAEREPLATQLAIELPDATIINAGISGATIATLLANFDAKVAIHNPDMVLFQVGTNDMYNPSSGTFDPTAMDQFKGAVMTLYNRILSIGAKPVMLGVPASTEADGAYTAWVLNERAMKYSRSLTAVF